MTQKQTAEMVKMVLLLVLCIGGGILVYYLFFKPCKDDAEFCEKSDNRIVAPNGKNLLVMDSDKNTPLRVGIGKTCCNKLMGALKTGDAGRCPYYYQPLTAKPDDLSKWSRVGKQNLKYGHDPVFESCTTSKSSDFVFQTFTQLISPSFLSSGSTCKLASDKKKLLQTMTSRTNGKIDGPTQPYAVYVGQHDDKSEDLYKDFD